MNSNRHQPVIDASNMKIEQIGIVVSDAHKTAKRYMEILGLGPWTFIDFRFRDFLYRGQPLGGDEFLVRAALTQFGNVQIELLQPMYGESTYTSFMERRGQGIHHLSLGVRADHDRVVSTLKSKGVKSEIEGIFDDRYKCTYLDMVADLGVFIEVAEDMGGNAAGPQPWGILGTDEPGSIDSKALEITQIGIVVEDMEKTARNYWDLFGIGPWAFLDLKSPMISNCRLHEVDMINSGDLRFRVGLADFGPLQIELLEPVSSQSTYEEFLKTCGQGVHHLSFGSVDNHDEMVSILKKQGIGIEMDGLVGDGVRFTYMATQRELGTIFEVVKSDNDPSAIPEPYGYYPAIQKSGSEDR